MDSLRVTAADDGMVRTHDDAVACLKYAALGARVRIEPVREPGSTRTNNSTRRYELLLPCLNGAVVTEGDVYKLPIPAEVLQRRAREVAEHAMRVFRA